ncbi:DUF1127 domain-containing protein [Rhizobium sp. SGZ-381]|uniref:DUF1127 domain-containing protein n=1 Tax=Rhizobium sp. SGZ-381 TaxID=3342800 RepID=UPI003672B666
MINNLRQLLIARAVRPHDTNAVEGIYRRFRRWQERRKDIETLRNMPDFLLKDIGLTRSHLDYPASALKSRRSER